MQTVASFRAFLIAFVTGIAIHVLPAISQQAELRIPGTIEKVDNSLLVVRGSAGVSSISLDAETAIFINRPSSLDEIKPGDFVASAAVKGADGKLHSKDVRIFPEALRGLGEGQRPMDAPDTIMTNASVSEVVAQPEGQVVKVKYRDGTAELIVGPGVPVTALVPANPSALKPGQKVFVLAGKAPDGSIKAKRILTVN
jgi:hypothetical protein